MNCAICPHFCELEDGEIGKCKVITRSGEKIFNPRENEFSNISVDSIEKRPFFHFLPGSKFLSCGWYGCNFLCKFCQNFTVSQQLGLSKTFTPEQLVELALSRNVAGIAFTHNEPSLYYEYIHKVRQHISSIGSNLKIAVKTNGFVNPYVMQRLCEDADAINIDIKGDNDDYKKICGGWILPVLNSIDNAAISEVHLEISYLVLPSKIENHEFNRQLQDFFENLRSNIPLHLLYYFPFYKMQEESYDPLKLIKLQSFFSEVLRHVYISNCYHPEVIRCRNTYCDQCGKLLIDRESGVKIVETECCNLSAYNESWNLLIQTT